MFSKDPEIKGDHLLRLQGNNGETGKPTGKPAGTKYGQGIQQVGSAKFELGDSETHADQHGRGHASSSLLDPFSCRQWLKRNGTLR